MKKRGRPGIAVQWEDKEFPSMTALADHLGVAVRTVSRWFATEDEGDEMVLHGRRFKSIKQASVTLNLKPSQIRVALLVQTKLRRSNDDII